MSRWALCGPPRCTVSILHCQHWWTVRQGHQEGIYQVLSKHWLNKRNNKRTWKKKKEIEFKETSLVGAEIIWSLFAEKCLGTISIILTLASSGSCKWLIMEANPQSSKSSRLH